MDGRNPAPLGNHGKPLCIGICGGIILGFLRWCEMDVVHPQLTCGKDTCLHSDSLNLSTCMICGLSHPEVLYELGADAVCQHTVVQVLTTRLERRGKRWLGCAGPSTASLTATIASILEHLCSVAFCERNTSADMISLYPPSHGSTFLESAFFGALGKQKQKDACPKTI